MTDNNNQDRQEAEAQKQDGHPAVGNDKPSCLGRCTNKQIVEREAQLRAKGSLIETMVYHIRTLSNAVVGFSDLLIGELKEEDLVGYVQEIYGAGQGLSVLANEVLDWTQLLSGELNIKRSKGPLSETLNGLEQLLSGGAKEKQLEYTITVDSDVPAYIHTDHERLLKCLVNLTASAIKHTSSGQVRIHVELEYFGDEPYVRFDVIDTGVGIEPEKLNKIFEPTVYRIEMDEEILSQLDRGLTVTTGLPLTLQLTELMGGTLEAQSRIGEGSTFTLRIPAGVNVSNESKLNTGEWKEPSPLVSEDLTANNESKRILLVEDQQSNRMVLTLMLEAIDVETDAVSGGYEAIERLQNNEYDMILMDLKMPEIDGYETTRRLRENGVTIPVIALSAKVMDDKEYQQISELFEGFIAKPVDQHKLSGIVDRFIGKQSNTKNPVSEEVTSGDDVVSFEYGV